MILLLCYKILNANNLFYFRSHDHSSRDSPHMHSLTEEEEEGGGVLIDGEGGPYHSPPALPQSPLISNPEQSKRRLIINSLIQSENNYLGKILAQFYFIISKLILPKKNIAA